MQLNWRQTRNIVRTFNTKTHNDTTYTCSNAQITAELSLNLYTMVPLKQQHLLNLFEWNCLASKFTVCTCLYSRKLPAMAFVLFSLLPWCSSTIWPIESNMLLTLDFLIGKTLDRPDPHGYILWFHQHSLEPLYSLIEWIHWYRIS